MQSDISNGKFYNFNRIIVLKTFWRTTIICALHSDLKKLIWKKIELTREHFLSIIFHNFRRGLARKEYIDELKSVCGDKGPSYSTVKTRLIEFNHALRSLMDEDREGRSKTAIVPENIDAVR